MQQALQGVATKSRNVAGPEARLHICTDWHGDFRQNQSLAAIRWSMTKGPMAKQLKDIKDFGERNLPGKVLEDPYIIQWMQEMNLTVPSWLRWND